MVSQAIPKNICQKMVEIFKKFQWQGTNETKKWVLLSCKWLSKSLTEGGLAATINLKTARPEHVNISSADCLVIQTS